ncbi:MAG: MFS transporter [Candidatus Lokiarchaeota archaeon]|nr:MFS transporter [Candidatus Lokiarchaeota archaeon]
MNEDTRTTPEESTAQKPKRIMASYGFGKFNYEFVTMAFGLFVIEFYEARVGLDPFLIILGYWIYTIWNMFNDPIVGHLTARPTRFAGKWGRRFPWIIFTVIPWGITYALLFSPPGIPFPSQWSSFAWMTVLLCLHDTFLSVWEVNYQSIFPDKFPNQKERRTAAGIATLVGILGIGLGAIVPALFVKESNIFSYATQGWIVFVFISFAFFLMLPGVREDRGMIDRYVKSLEQLKGQEPSFMSNLKDVFKNRNFLAFVILYMFYQSCTLTVQASMVYVVSYILGYGASSVTLMMAGFILGALITIPIWMKIAQKVQNNQRMIMIGAVIMIVFMVPLIFPQTYWTYVIVSTLWGTGLGLFWAMTGPVMADVADEYVVLTKKRRDGMMFGFRAFFGRLAYGIQVMTIVLIHVVTGFDPNTMPTIPSDSIYALGVRLHLALFPIIFLIIGLLIFWRGNTITPEKMKEIKRQLADLNI